MPVIYFWKSTHIWTFRRMFDTLKTQKSTAARRLWLARQKLFLFLLKKKQQETCSFDWGKQLRKEEIPTKYFQDGTFDMNSLRTVLFDTWTQERQGSVIVVHFTGQGTRVDSIQLVLQSLRSWLSNVRLHICRTLRCGARALDGIYGGCFFPNQSEHFNLSQHKDIWTS